MKLHAKNIARTASVATLLAPLAVLAQNFTYVDNWVDKAKGYLNTAVVLIMVLMTLFFLIRVFQLISAKDAEAQKEKKKEVFNALLGLFIAVAVWGIINLAASILGTGTGNDATSQATCPPGYTYSKLEHKCI